MERLRFCIFKYFTSAQFSALFIRYLLLGLYKGFPSTYSMEQNLLQKLTFPQLVKFPALYKPEGSLQCSQALVTGSRPEPAESSLHPHKLFHLF
jgi:hypothetical protein